MTSWIRYRRKGGQTADPAPLVSIRINAIAFNAHFVATARLATKSHVAIFVDPKRFGLGFRFHDQAPDDDTIALTNDGGGGVRGGGGRCAQIAGLMREHPWLAAVAGIEDPRLRRFAPRWISADSMWTILLRPSFERHVSDRSEIPARTTGVYRYKSGDEIVYIGRGEVRSRAGSRERAEWDFETIEYSVIPDEGDQTKWEAFWLDRFVEEHGKLPLYNRILGSRPSEHRGSQQAASPNGGPATWSGDSGVSGGPPSVT